MSSDRAPTESHTPDVERFRVEMETGFNITDSSGRLIKECDIFSPKLFEIAMEGLDNQASPQEIRFFLLQLELMLVNEAWKRLGPSRWEGDSQLRSVIGHVKNVFLRELSINLATENKNVRGEIGVFVKQLHDMLGRVMEARGEPRLQSDRPIVGSSGRVGGGGVGSGPQHPEE